ncbi:MAG: HNH endonuclease family protein [Mycoplasmoidaceae bacterium]
MKIRLENIKVRALVDGYVNIKGDSSKNIEDEGVRGFGGKLNIRPPYQREFLYEGEQKNEVIRSVINNFPLNVMYWVDNENDTYEVLDGQQRIISICSYIIGEFSVDGKFFHSLTQKEKDVILDYELFVYFVIGDEREKLDWFKVINIAGLKLDDQELRNAIYVGPWLMEAKRYFSDPGKAGDYYSKNYQNKVAIRQALLEYALEWICMKEEMDVEEYMSKHQHDKNADELIEYFEKVIEWVKKNFVDVYPDMKSINWGELYHKYKDIKLNYLDVSKDVKRLRGDSDVLKKTGIYEYILSGNESLLNIRSFTDTDKITAYTNQKGICVKCNDHFEMNEMDADHIDPWSKGGKTELKNLQMLCKNCNRKKSNK